jgi:hypothetical protein
MIGLIVGTLCLVALFATVRRRRYYAFREAWGYHGHPWGGRHGFRAARRRHPLHLLFARLDTTPGQEKAIVAALDTMRERMEGTRRELDALCRELAVVVGGAVLDERSLDEVKARGDALYGRFSAELRELLARVHDALDEGQRRRFAELIRDGSLFLELCGRANGLGFRAGQGCAEPYGHGYAY